PHPVRAGGGEPPRLPRADAGGAGACAAPGTRLRDPRRRARHAVRRAAPPPGAHLRCAGQRDQARTDHRRGLPRRADALSGPRGATAPTDPAAPAHTTDEKDGARHPLMATSLLTRVKAQVDLHTSNRARGLIQGRGRSLFKGSGEDFDDLKYYQPGDKISDIDWKATARSGEPLIRQFNEERV